MFNLNFVRYIFGIYTLMTCVHVCQGAIHIIIIGANCPGFGSSVLCPIRPNVQGGCS